MVLVLVVVIKDKNNRNVEKQKREEGKWKLFLVKERASLPSSSLNMPDFRAKNPRVNRTFNRKMKAAGDRTCIIT